MEKSEFKKYLKERQEQFKLFKAMEEALEEYKESHIKYMKIPLLEKDVNFKFYKNVGGSFWEYKKLELFFEEDGILGPKIFLQLRGNEVGNLKYKGSPISSLNSIKFNEERLSIVGDQPYRMTTCINFHVKDISYFYEIKKFIYSLQKEYLP